MLKGFGVSVIQLSLKACNDMQKSSFLSFAEGNKLKQICMCNDVWYDLISTQVIFLSHDQNVDMCLKNENHLIRGFLSFDLS